MDIALYVVLHKYDLKSLLFCTCVYYWTTNLKSKNRNTIKYIDYFICVFHLGLDFFSAINNYSVEFLSWSFESRNVNMITHG
jgi:hypothetical protein